MQKLFSRKFILTLLIVALGFITPVFYGKAGISDALTLTVLSLFGAVGIAYGVVNYKSKVSGADEDDNEETNEPKNETKAQ